MNDNNEISVSAGRIYALDNLRGITIVCLIVFHICMIYTGTEYYSFYIQGPNLEAGTVIMTFLHVWMMPLMFAIAGISAAFSLRRRSVKVFVTERVTKLLVPLFFGMLLVIPVQSYISSLSHTGTGNYLDYFTKVTDLQGLDGGFTPGQLWFLLFLFIISLVCLPLMLLYRKKSKQTLLTKTPLVILIALAIVPPLVKPYLSIGGKSFCEYTAYFLMGFFFLSDRAILRKLDRYRFLLSGLSLLLIGLTFWLQYFGAVLIGEPGAEQAAEPNFWINALFTLSEAGSWITVLAILALGHHYLNFNGKILGYLSKSSFGAYIFHQTWIIVLAYFIFKITPDYKVQIPLILVSAFVLTYLTNEICKRFKATRLMFGLKK